MRRLALVLILAAAPARAAENFITPEMDQWLLKGVDGIYDMRFEEAEVAARKAIELNPEYPNGYMGVAGILWTKYVYGTDQCDQTLLVPFDRAIKKTIEVSQKWLKKHPKDAMALMTLGAAYGVQSRLMVIRHEWLSAYWTGRKAVNITREAVKVDPQLWDAYLGIGMYDYYTDLYPRFIGVLAKIVLRGNRLRGIETLRLVAEKGHFSRNNAKILLVEIYTEDPLGAKNPEKAVELMKDLRGRYPDSAMMHSAQLVALYEAGRLDDVVKGGLDFVAKVKAGKYHGTEEAKGWVCLATGLWAQKKYEQALDAFRHAEEVRYQGKPSRWAIWAHIRAGNLEDSINRRADAVKDYKFAAAQPDQWDFKKFARAGLAKPFQAIYPGPIDPP